MKTGQLARNWHVVEECSRFYSRENDTCCWFHKTDHVAKENAHISAVMMQIRAVLKAKLCCFVTFGVCEISSSMPVICYGRDRPVPTVTDVLHRAFIWFHLPGFNISFLILSLLTAGIDSRSLLCNAAASPPVTNNSLTNNVLVLLFSGEKWWISLVFFKMSV